MRALLVILIPLVAADLYKETQNFQYSRTGDGEKKEGYFGAQTGNMEGNYEVAHNMDHVAQNQMKGLMHQVGSQLGIDPVSIGKGGVGPGHLPSGSVYGSASSHGTAYGVKGVGAGRDRVITYVPIDQGSAQYGSDYSYNGRTAGQNYNARTGGQRVVGHSDYGAGNTDYRTVDSAALTSQPGYRQTGGQQVNHEAGSRYGSESSSYHSTSSANRHQTVNTNGGTPVRTVYVPATEDHGSGSHVAASQQTGRRYFAGYDTSFGTTDNVQHVNQPIHVRPGSTVRLVVTPNQNIPITVPVPASQRRTFTQGSQSAYEGSVASESQVQQREKADNSRLIQGVDVNSDATNRQQVGAGGSKSYQSSYEYQKSWERHGSAGAAPSQVTSVPVGGHVDLAHAAQNRDQLLVGTLEVPSGQHGSTTYNSGSRVASTGRHVSTAGQSNYQVSKGEQGGYYNPDAVYRIPNNRQVAGTQYTGSTAHHTTAQDYQTSGRQQAANQMYTAGSNVEGIDANQYNGQAVGSASRPKSYQSSYSYHKSWEKHGTPYVIQPGSQVSTDGYSGVEDSQRNGQSSGYTAGRTTSASNGYVAGAQYGESHSARQANTEQAGTMSMDLEAMQQKLRDQMAQMCGNNCGTDGKTKGYSASYSYSAHRSYGGASGKEQPDHQRYRRSYTHPRGHYEDQNEDSGQVVDYTQSQYSRQRGDSGQYEFYRRPAQSIQSYRQSQGSHYTQHRREYYHQQEDLGQQSEDIGQETEYHPYSHRMHEPSKPKVGKLVHGDKSGEQIEELGQQVQELGQETESSISYPRRRTLDLQVGQLVQKSEDLGQQMEELGQQVQDLEQESISHYTPRRRLGNSNLQVGQLTHKSEDLGQQPEALDQESVSHYGSSRRQEVSNLQVGKLTRKSEDLGQQMEDLGQQTEDLEQESVSHHSPSRRQEISNIQVGKLTQKSEDLGQQQEDLGQQMEELGQEVQDLGHESISHYTSSRRQGASNLQVGQLTQKSEDLGQQPEDLGQQQLGQQTQEVVSHYGTGKREGASSLNVGKLTRKDEGIEQEPKRFRQVEELGQEVQESVPHEGLSRRQGAYNPQVGQLTQKSEDLEQEPEDLGQQTEDMGQETVTHYGTSRRRGFSDIQVGQLTQKSEDLGQEPEDLGQQTEDMGQETVSHYGTSRRRGSSYSQVGQLTQKSEDLGQEPEDLGQQTEDMGHETVSHYGTSRRRGSSDLQVGQLIQKNEYLGQEPEDLGQQVQELGQKTEDLEQPTNLNFNSNQRQGSYNLQVGEVQKNEDLGQQTEEIGSHQGNHRTLYTGQKHKDEGSLQTSQIKPFGKVNAEYTSINKPKKVGHPEESGKIDMDSKELKPDDLTELFNHLDEVIKSLESMGQYQTEAKPSSQKATTYSSTLQSHKEVNPPPKPSQSYGGRHTINTDEYPKPAGLYSNKKPRGLTGQAYTAQETQFNSWNNQETELLGQESIDVPQSVHVYYAPSKPKELFSASHVQQQYSGQRPIQQDNKYYLQTYENNLNTNMNLQSGGQNYIEKTTTSKSVAGYQIHHAQVVVDPGQQTEQVGEWQGQRTEGQHARVLEQDHHGQATQHRQGSYGVHDSKLVVQPTTTTEPPGFWSRVGNKLGEAKDTAKSWVGLAK